ncbi:MAG: hypothetical protein FWD24_01970 [Treponema sp.]|nr:hypothetical protein [Treponema sp.]
MTALAVAMGLLLPGIFIHLRPFVILLFGIMTFSGALKLTAKELGIAVQNPLAILLFFFISHVIMPVIALFSSSLFFADLDLVTGFVLLFAGPTAVSGFIWVSIYKGDKALGLTLILLSTLLAPLIVPFTLSVLIGEKVVLDMSGIAISLLFMVVIPTIIGVLINETSKGKIPKVICPGLDPFAKICLILVIAANSAVVAPNIRFDNLLIWQIALLCITLTVTGFILSKFTGILTKCGEEKSISLFFAGGLRNFSAVLTIAVAFFPESTALPTLLCIVFQQIIAAIMGKIMVRKTNSHGDTGDTENTK